MSNAKALVVDDEQLIRWSLGKNLQKSGYAVDTAEKKGSVLLVVRA